VDPVPPGLFLFYRAEQTRPTIRLIRLSVVLGMDRHPIYLLCERRRSRRLSPSMAPPTFGPALQRAGSHKPGKAAISRIGGFCPFKSIGKNAMLKVSELVGRQPCLTAGLLCAGWLHDLSRSSGPGSTAMSEMSGEEIHREGLAIELIGLKYRSVCVGIYSRIGERR